MSHRRVVQRWAMATLALLLVAGGCSETGGTATTTSAEPTATTLADGALAPMDGDGSVVSRYAGAEWTLGTVPTTATAADDTLAPIKIGFMNTDSGPIAATPELHEATDAAVAFINTELGGVDGHPIEIVPCEVDLSPEKAQTCARTLVSEGVVAVLNGLGLASDAAVKILEENNIAWVGGIPLNEGEMRSPIAFQFSGGSPGAFVAFAQHVGEVQGAKKAAVMYVNTPQVSIAAEQYGVKLLEALGVDVTPVPFDLGTQDYAAVVSKAIDSNPEAILVGAADFACPKVMQALVDIGTDATVYMVGSCADRKWLDQVGIDNVVGTVFNVEGRLDAKASTDADTEIYADVIEKYAPDTNARGAATVAFRSTMNLYSVLSEIGAAATPQQIIDTFRAAKDRPSYDGHAYTCDGKQVPGLPSLCAAQGVLGRLDGPDQFSEVSDGWIDVPAIVAKYL